MKLLPFQRECVSRTTEFFKQVQKWQAEETIVPNIPQVAWDSLAHPPDTRPYCTVKNSRGMSIPCASIVIPTGGGKTITALSAGIEALRALSDKWSCLVWTVPSDAIYTQTKKYFEEGYLRDFAIGSGYARLNLKVIGDPWTDLDLDSSILTVLLVSQQSIFGDRADLYFKRPSDSLRHLSIWKSTSLKPTLLNFLQEVLPVFVVDECHRTYTKTGRAFFRETATARAILEFSATPKDFSTTEYPNVIHSVPAADLIAEQLIKNPLTCHFDPNKSAKRLIQDAVHDRKVLERKLRKVNFVAKPKFLISCQQSGMTWVLSTLILRLVNLSLS